MRGGLVLIGLFLAGPAFGQPATPSQIVSAIQANVAATRARAANDEAMLADTLRHFGNHGLNSAEVAALRALAAHDRGDDSDFAHWLSICGMFDRRLAEATKRGAPAKA